MKITERKASLWVIGLFAFTFLILWVFSKGMIVTMIVIVVYFFLLNILSYFERKFDNRILKIINLFLSVPLALVFIIGDITIPVITLLMHTIYFFTLAFMFPIGLILINHAFKIIDLSKGTQVFVALTIGALESVVLYKYIIRLVYSFSPIKVNNSEKYEKFKLKELTEYLLTPKNIKFIFYTLYFIYLIIFSIMYLENKIFFISQTIDFAVLQAFLVFLAFDSLVTNSKEIRVIPTKLLYKMVVGIFSKDKDDDIDIESDKEQIRSLFRKKKKIEENETPNT
jgi:hypothetical protein